MRLYNKFTFYSIFFTSIAFANSTTTKNNVIGLVPGGGEHSISFIESAGDTNYKIIFSNPDQQQWFKSRIACDSNHLCNAYFSAKANSPDIASATGYIKSENVNKNTSIAFSLSSMHPQVNLKIERDKESPNTFQINLINAIPAPLIFGNITINNAEISSNTCPNIKIYPIGDGNSSCSFKAKVNDNTCGHKLNIPILTGNNKVLSTITKNINLCS